MNYIGSKYTLSSFIEKIIKDILSLNNIEKIAKALNMKEYELFKFDEE